MFASYSSATCNCFVLFQMTKKIKKLEKETTQWRTKWESNNQALLQMAEEVEFILVYSDPLGYLPPLYNKHHLEALPKKKRVQIILNYMQSRSV